MRSEFEIDGMTCDHCVRAVTAALRRLPTVRDVTVTIGHAVVESDAGVTAEQVNHALSDEGYRVRS